MTDERKSPDYVLGGLIFVLFEDRPPAEIVARARELLREHGYTPRFADSGQMADV